MIGQLLGQRHGNLTWPRDRPAALGREQIRAPDIEIVCNRLLDILDRHHLVLRRNHVAQRIPGELHRDGLAGKLGIGDHTPERTLEFADVGADAFANEESDFVRQIHAEQLHGLAFQDGDTSLEIRRLDGDRQSPAKAGFEPFLQTGNLFRITVAGQDDLLL